MASPSLVSAIAAWSTWLTPGARRPEHRPWRGRIEDILLTAHRCHRAPRGPVLAGEPTFQVGDDLVTGGPGSWVYAPKNAPHTLANHAKHTARMLCLFAPAGFERRFERMMAQQDAETGVPDHLAQLAEAERMTQVVGPPIADRNR